MSNNSISKAVVSWRKIEEASRLISVEPQSAIIGTFKMPKSYFKAGFLMIADDRRRSQRELFPYNRRRSQAIAEPAAAIHYGQQKC